ncbi:MAG TPA: MFS transporter [Dongiaceae bacterium]|jgi:MFS family permease
MPTDISAISRALTRPGAVVFAMLFLFDSMARSLLSGVLPVVGYEMLGSKSLVSAMFLSAGAGGAVASLFIPWVLQHVKPRWLYTAAAALLIAANGLFMLGGGAAFAAGLFMRSFAAACLLNLLNLYIMTYIRKKDLARSEPVRTFFSGIAWSGGPLLGVMLLNHVSPYAVFSLSAFCAALLLAYFWRLRLEYGAADTSSQPRNANPLPHIRRFLQQPRLRLAWILNFSRETWWVALFIYGPIYTADAMMGPDAPGYLQSASTSFLFLTPIAGWLARHFGLRLAMMGAFTYCAAGTLAAAAVMMLDGPPLLGCILLVTSGIGAITLDSVAMVPFLRAVRVRERAEMTMVFTTYRDLAGLVPFAVFSLILAVIDELWIVYGIVSCCLLGSAWLSRHIPRGM